MDYKDSLSKIKWVDPPKNLFNRPIITIQYVIFKTHQQTAVHNPKKFPLFYYTVTCISIYFLNPSTFCHLQPGL